MWITSITGIVCALIALAGVYFAPAGVAEKIAPNAAVTVTQTVTVSANPTDSGTPGTGAPVYLADEADLITASQGSYGPGAYAINGTSYLHSFGLEIYSSSYTAWTEYTLDGTYRTFTATLGLNDELATDSAAEFVISGSAGPLLRKTVKLTEKAPISVNITGMVKLRIAVTRVSGETDSHVRGAVFGDAALNH